jgi:hypothetical protein
LLQELQEVQGLREVPEGQTLTRSPLDRKNEVNPMKVAVVSEDFHTLSGPAGKARRFLLFEAETGRRPQLERYFELPVNCPTYHDLHEDDEAFHPIDGMTLITAEAGEGFRERLARRGTQVHITTEQDPHTAVSLFLEGRLPQKAPSARHASQCA